MIRVVRGDLARAGIDAVVRTVRSDGEPITALGRRLAEAAGAEAASRWSRDDDAPLGMATLSPAGGLSASFVIQVALQSMEEPVTGATVERGMLNCLRRAADFGVESVGFPPLGVGPGNLDAEEAARIMVRVLTDHVQGGHPPGVVEVYVESDYDLDVFRTLFDASGLTSTDR